MEFYFKPNSEVDIDELLYDEDDIIKQRCSLLVKSLNNTLPGSDTGLNPISLIEPISRRVALETYESLLNTALMNDPVIVGSVTATVEYVENHSSVSVDFIDVMTGEILNTSYVRRDNMSFDYSTDDVTYDFQIFAGYVKTNEDKEIILNEVILLNPRLFTLLSNPDDIDGLLEHTLKISVPSSGYTLDISNIINALHGTIAYSLYSIESDISMYINNNQNSVILTFADSGLTMFTIKYKLIDMINMPSISVYEDYKSESVPFKIYMNTSTKLKNILFERNKRYYLKTVDIIINEVDDE